MLKKKRASPKNTPPKEEDFDLKLSYWHEEVVEVHLEMLKPYPGHPFKPYAPEALEALAESIRQNGLQQPIIVRDLEEQEQWEYTILSGHNRVEAVRLLGKDHIPAIIRQMDDAAAALTVVQTNLEQRQKLLPSERAYAYAMWKQACSERKKQSGDIPCDDNALEEFGQIVRNENERQIFRYLRLTHLLPELLDQVDLGNVPVNAGVDLSYLDEGAQGAVYAYFFDGQREETLTLKSAAMIRKAFDSGRAIQEDTLPVILNTPPKKRKSKACTISNKRLRQYRIPQDVDLVEVICGLLEKRFGRV